MNSTQKFLRSCSKEELREVIEFGRLVTDPLSQEMLRKLAE